MTLVSYLDYFFTCICIVFTSLWNVKIDILNGLRFMAYFLGNTKTLWEKEGRKENVVLWNRGKYWSAHCSASLASSVSCERATTRPLGERETWQRSNWYYGTETHLWPRRPCRKTCVPTVQGVVVVSSTLTGAAACCFVGAPLRGTSPCSSRQSPQVELTFFCMLTELWQTAGHWFFYQFI